jgi:two-component system, OmpR family, KDP operon response regulator KdpE
MPTAYIRCTLERTSRHRLEPFSLGTETLVLAVDDEPGILRLIRLTLSSEGFRVVTADNAPDALRIVEEQRPDIALLDLIMPDTGGLDLMHEIKDRRHLPVILLTGMGGDANTSKGLDQGADDYLMKPFNPDELCARVRSVLRRFSGGGREGIVTAGDIEINLADRTVRKSGDVVVLTRTEWRLLQELAANQGRMMLNEELLEEVWGAEHRSDLQYLRVWISRLRRKLEADAANPRLIKNFSATGYMLVADL